MTAPTSATPTIRPGLWTVDPQRSRAGFAVKNFLVLSVRGAFPIHEATVSVSPDGEPTEVRARMDAAGFTTGNRKRDAHVRNPDFLDTESHPDVLFASTEVARPGADGPWVIRGLLTIRGRATPITLTTYTVQTSGTAATVRATGTVDRFEAGLTYGNSFGVSRLATLDLHAELVHAG
ncbi:YceI family protein [Embleya sp. NPDC059237]|uniref:YceI family protein n=1 Tax=Embleya sp. NPDC059237 TaxID=3346784 RepID=UPI0036D0A416